MSTSHIIETLRVRTQRELDNAKTHSERNRLGQFATPPRLALAILQESRKFFGEEGKARFLDPAFGTGAFYSALLETFPPERIESARGFEIDPHYGKQAEELWNRSSLKLEIRDFFSIPVLEGEGDKANLIVCNPPYVRHHHLSVTQKEQLSRLTAKSVGVKANGLSGLYCYFLIYAHNWLGEGGLGCWLIPSEFMDVNYGIAVKEYLLRKVTLLRIHRFDPKESQFDDALVSSAVVWFKKSPPSGDRSVEFTFGGTLNSPHLIRSISPSELLRVTKWTRFTNGHAGNDDSGMKLGDLFNVKRGLATGANEFFVLTPEDTKLHNLPSKFLIPILPSPRYLKQDVIHADKKGNPLTEKPHFLLSCGLPPQQVKREFPSLWKYLKLGVQQKIHEGYLCQHRSPWYAQENRPASPFLCTYMGRHDSPKGSPFRFILNLSNATAANVYLILYPKPELSKLIEKHPSLVKTIWGGLSKISSESLVREGRVYGGGLHKMEPRELANASAETVLELVPELRSNLPSTRSLLFPQESFA